MLSIKLFPIVMFGGLFAVFYCNPIMDERSDVKWDCRNFDFNASLNITAQSSIVVVFNSALCQRCAQKLLSFKALQLQFEIAEYNEIKFIMLTTEHYGTKEFAELQSKAGDITIVSLHDMNNDFFVAGSVYVFDKCSRLTYELIPPWSQMHYQLVKAAILSTWYSTPCGKCESDAEELADFMQYENEMSTTAEVELANTTSEIEADDYEDDYKIQIQSNDSAYEVNMRVIMPLIHVHHLENNTYLKYNYIVLNSNDNATSSHDHLDNDVTEILYDNEVLNSINSSYVNPPEYLKNAEGLRFKVTVTHPDTNRTQDTNIYQEVEIIHDVVVVTPVPKLTNSHMGNTINSSMLASLRPWLSYRLLNRF